MCSVNLFICLYSSLHFNPSMGRGLYTYSMCVCESVYHYLILLCFVSERFQTVYTRRIHFGPTIPSVFLMD